MLPIIITAPAADVKYAEIFDSLVVQPAFQK